MKKIIIALLCFCTAACGDNESHLSTEEVDKLFQDQPLLLEDTAAIAITPVQAFERSKETRVLHIRLPEVDDIAPTKIVATIVLAADTVSSFNLSCSKGTGVESKPQTVTPEKTAVAVIQPNDTKIKIAKRLGVKPSQIGNKDPLKVGQTIIITQ